MNQEEKTDISFKGKLVKVDMIRIGNSDIIVTGKAIKTARVKIEWDEDVNNPEEIVDAIKKSKIRVDIFTFLQNIPYIEPKYTYYMEKEAIASLHVVSHADWWKNLPKKTRQNIRNTEKLGVTVRLAEFNDEFVKGIMSIYNDSPVRQGKQFWHYGKNFDTVKRENATYLERCDFIGAYLKDELIGFIKLVYSGKTANPMQIISKVQHRDDKLKPASLLVSKAVEICEKNSISYFTYGLWDDGSLSEFKKRNGFEKVFLPRYYIPLTIIGAIAVRYNIHRGIRGILSENMVNTLKYIRNRLYSIYYKGNISNENQ